MRHALRRPGTSTSVMKTSTWPKPFRYFRDIKTFLISLSIAVTAILGLIFFLRYHAVNKLLVQSVKLQAASYANLIVVARHWNAQYGGVYVEKRPGVESNRFLKQLGIEPDLRTADGRVLTLRNPAIMTREISDLAFLNDIVRFHMISLDPLNPENSPDRFERSSLERFKRGESELWEIEQSGPKPLFRFILPLTVERTCLPCHARQGYQEGDLRGGVSVMIPAGPLLEQMHTNRRHVVVDFAVTVAVLLGILFFLTWTLALRLDRAQKRLKTIATTDELTGLRNRRYIMDHLDKEYQRAARTGAPLSLILLDIDHFKKVNDTHGHAFGDVVLKAVAREMEGSLRSYDLLGRIGGEEFLIASPGSAIDDAVALAERIRERIKARTIANRTRTVQVTVSAGVASLSEQDTKAENLLGRADDALYQAKHRGRDQVVTL